MDRFLMQAKTGKKIQPKTILIVRHGQSEHNAGIYANVGADDNDERYIDAPLTQQGESQAKFISEQVEKFKPQLIVSSPFTRAIQTAKIATSTIQNKPSHEVTQLCSERMCYSCDIGSPVSELENKFAELDFSNIPNPDTWWWTKHERNPDIKKSQKRTLQLIRNADYNTIDDVTEPDNHFFKRVNDFRLWLLNRDENRIVVFAHGVFLYGLIGGKGPYFSNCEMREIVL